MYARLLGQGLKARAQAHSISIGGLWMICLVAAAASQISNHRLNDSKLASLLGLGVTSFDIKTRILLKVRNKTTDGISGS